MHGSARLAALLVAGFLTTGSVFAAELITNGDFEGSSTAVGVSDTDFDGVADITPEGWSRIEDFADVIEAASINPVAGQGGSQAWGFARTEPVGADHSGNWTAIEQSLNLAVGGYSALDLSLDLMVVSHDLAAGGWTAPAFEWPAVVEIGYELASNTNPTGPDQIWRYGWYVEPPGDTGDGSVEGDDGPVNDPGQGLIPFFNDRLVSASVWTSDSFNLLAELPGAVTITSLRVGGSGWSYSSAFDNVSLQGTPVPEPASAALLLFGFAALKRRRR